MAFDMSVCDSRMRPTISRWFFFGDLISSYKTRTVTAMYSTPVTASSTDKMRAKGVTGTMSPYPRVVRVFKEEKEEEYEDYGKQIAELAQGYMQQDPGRLQQLYEQGNVMLGSAGAPGEIRISSKII